MNQQCLSCIIFVALILSVSGCVTATEEAATSTAPAWTAIPILAATVAPTSTVTPHPIPAEPADVIFHNGIIITMEKSQSLAEAIAFRNGLIQAVGADEEILALQGPETKMIDLQSKTLMPGFVDSHTHILKNIGLSMEDAQQLALENGFTTLTEMTAPPEFVEQIKVFAGNGKLRVRTSLYLEYTDTCGQVQGDWYLKYPQTHEFGEMLRIGGVKLFADGGEQTCGGIAYSFDPPGGQGRGNLWFTQAELDKIVAEIQSNGYQVAIHAQGDRAIEQAQNSIAFALNGETNTPRHRIEHNAILRPDLLPRYGEIGVVATIFGTANTCREVNEGRMTTRFGQEHLAWLENWRALVDANPELHIAWHGDYPAVQPISPLMHLYSLVTRKQVDKNGNICNPPQWLADHALTTEEVLRMMTIEGAYALFREDEVGSLAPGKLADVIVLSGNPLNTHDGIKDLSVLVTAVGGKTEYCATGKETLCP
ncbi:MAG: amidohydrolase family protein [Chloroflexi bacterium]|nr:amidohydrolase family protein [Chloroflexota bacterium]